ncbi:hypothetical protein BCU70_13450 [Vibrio sp. 10N.286.49.C2]|nr:hypothetical protein BCU70_13450 [Vibrio sp. 10N.286.49.C2]PMH55282.1 hypothetical protein BCU66_09220 [Vibrio sp. 10N.286.49.B1]PMH83823.1 hypothetical protein BCU58_13625 [Vibrio sp. 10N.286.48.B7]
MIAPIIKVQNIHSKVYAIKIIVLNTASYIGIMKIMNRKGLERQMKSQRVATRGGKLRRVATERLIVVG